MKFRPYTYTRTQQFLAPLWAAIIKNEYVGLHRYIHVWHIKQLESISLKFFMLSLNSQTDLLDFM